MINRKILYGYRIRNGILEIAPEEQQAVERIFTLYNAGASYQGISDALNQGNIPYSQEVPLWNKHKVKRLLENPRYSPEQQKLMVWYTYFFLNRGKPSTHIAALSQLSDEELKENVPPVLQRLIETADHILKGDKNENCAS